MKPEGSRASIGPGEAVEFELSAPTGPSLDTPGDACLIPRPSQEDQS